MLGDFTLTWEHGVRVVVSIVLVLFLLRLLWHWFKDLRFYADHGWKYDKHSGSPDIYPGDEYGPNGPPLSNFSRVWFGYPFFIVGVVLVLLAFIFVDFK